MLSIIEVKHCSVAYFDHVTACRAELSHCVDISGIRTVHLRSAYMYEPLTEVQRCTNMVMRLKYAME